MEVAGYSLPSRRALPSSSIGLEDGNAQDLGSTVSTDTGRPVPMLAPILFAWADHLPQAMAAGRPSSTSRLATTT